MQVTIEMDKARAGGAGRPHTEDQAVARLLEQLLDEAMRLDASHLHCDPGEEHAELAFRTGGLLHPYRQLSTEQARLLVERVTQEADMGAPGQSPTQGGLPWRGQALEVSLLPVLHGHRMVLRRPPMQSGHRGLEALGIGSALAQEVRTALADSGLILVASPANNGRGATLHMLASIAASRTRPLLAIAPNPVPPSAGVTVIDSRCAAVADSIIAAIVQDIDVLMIDSIEDRAVAAAAMAAAQAGRLVIAGIEAPSAVAAIQQMRNWRIDAFQLASTMSMVLAQRLVQRLCGTCREPVQASGSVSALLGFDPGAIVYAPAGCGACSGTGFSGQTAVFEGIRGDATIRRLVNDGGDAAILARHAFIQMPNLGSAARTLARTGVTTPEEAVRISRG
ncbi:ATPase, T2SS/T4P/T4SS family [Sphingomonas sp. HT-1]|uniref:ATPase, T2SS/T4P/T4SS family n=1 Tax=unclassified Sphingomonas TaxID=196159 RepID=UPI000304E28F|nr:MULTISPECIES: ATPase, T2SS/T4P/T4SS family [unclassified Sphingomonas]KTF70122.1 type II secretion protein ATPase [Sphingomonas sp. WG]